MERRLANNKAKTTAASSGDPEGKALVGVGSFSAMTSWEASFQSSHTENKNFVQEILQHPVKVPGSQLDLLRGKKHACTCSYNRRRSGLGSNCK